MLFQCLSLAFLLSGLVKLHASGELKLEGDEWGHLQDAAAFEEFLQPLREKTWERSFSRRRRLAMESPRRPSTW